MPNQAGGGPPPSPPSSSLLFAPPSSPVRKKRERVLSRNLRPLGSSDVVQEPPSPVSPDSPASALSPSPSMDACLLPQQRPTSTSFLTLPLFVSTSTCPASPGSGSQDRLSRPRSMRESPSFAHQTNTVLPSHNQTSRSPPRARLFSSPRLVDFDNAPAAGWSNRARRWSSTLPANRGSSGLAYRLAEGASPYLRAGLDELRSIFDVDSDPIPITALDEDDSSKDEEARCEAKADISLNLDSASSERCFTSSPDELGGSTPEESSVGPSLARQSSPTDRGARQHSQPREPNEKAAARTDDTPSYDGSFSAAGLGIDRGILAWSLAVIAAGMTALCAYGYAMHSDTFSVTLIGFFLTQPAFSLMGLSALVLRRRALMDLFSRAMRAHVLAQAGIVLLAYLDLSASSFYIGQSSDSPRGRAAAAFRMVPTMEMRFGPAHSPLQAGDTPGISLLYSSGYLYTGMGSSQSSSSAHAHDTHVGDFQSRLTHLVVFVVQAALPIIAILVGQYMVAQRLAWLARRTCVSRQNSINKQQQQHDKAASPRSRTGLYESKTLPPSFAAERLSNQLARDPSRRTKARLPSAGSGAGGHPLHARSLSQPLDLVHPPTEASSSNVTALLPSATLSASSSRDE